MQKTLYLLEYTEGRSSALVAFYAVDQEAANEYVLNWARVHHVIFHREPSITPHPRGFTMGHRELPGHIEVEEEACEQKERPEA